MQFATAHTPHTFPSIVDTFKRKLESLRTKAYCGRQYILVDQLQDWLNTREESQEHTNIRRLLSVAFSDTYQKVDSRQLSQSYIVFAILMEHDYGHHIDKFLDANITDSRLSEDLSMAELQRNLGGEAPQIIDAFYNSRWAFCPARFELDSHTIVRSRDQIIPYCSRERINEGGTADVWQVTIKEEMLSSDMKDRMTQFRFECAGHGICYRLAIKCYAEKDYEVFNWEREAFNVLRGQAGMVQCFGSYEIDEINPEYRRGQDLRNFALILEFGERDLMNYLEDTSQIPPILPEEIFSFWNELFKVSDALSQFHHTKYRNADTSTYLSGWHSDVKPENILRVNGEFKLADFGFSKFRKFEKKEVVPSEYIYGGTFAYGAPECEAMRQNRGTTTNVTQTIDTWSFGCVLSEAATWLALGYQGLEQYQEFRIGVVRDLRRRHAPEDRSKRGIQIPRSDSSFHDGYRVLPQIRLWHDYVRNSTRRTDTITDRVLTLVEDHLLLEDPHARYSSNQLSDALKIAEWEARQDVQAHFADQRLRQIAPELQQRLVTIEQTAAARQGTSNSNLTVMSKDTTPLESEKTARDKGIILGPLPTRNYRKSQRAGKTEWIEKNPLSRTAHRNPETMMNTIPLAHLTESPNTYDVDIDEPGPSDRWESRNVPLPAPLKIRTKETYAHKENGGTYGRGLTSPQTLELSPHPHMSSVPSMVTHPDYPGLHNTHEIRSNPHPNFATPQVLINILNTSASRPEDTRDPGGQIHPATPPNSPETKIKKYEQKGFDPMDSLISSRSEPQEGPSDTAILLNEEKILLQSPVPIEEEPSNVSIQIDEYATVTDVRNKHPELDIFIVRRELERKNPGLIRSWLINSPRNKRLSYFVSNRDIVFVVDNAPTMRPWWALVSFVVETMAMNLTGLDKDGLDLLFTGTDKFRLKGKKADAPSKFLKNIREATPNDRSMNTDMAASLGTIFDEYIRTPQEKGMTLLVFTDGLWTGGAEDDAVEKALVKFITRTKDYKMDRQMKRRFSIEFIYFGHDQKAIDRLRALDDEIKTKHELPDIVDHEPWTGDVDKMITGSFLESKDVQKPDAGLSPPGLSRVDSNTPSMNSLSSPTQPSKRSSFFGNRKGKSAETR